MKKTLKSRYSISNKRSFGRLAFLCSIFACLVFCFTTIARYENNLDGHIGNVGVANFKFLLNDQQLLNTTSELTDAIVPTLTSDAPKRGYFNVTVNPTGTEVSFELVLTLDMAASTLPQGLRITHYSLDPDAHTNVNLRIPIPADNKYRKTFILVNNAFAASDAITIIYFWNWDEQVGGEVTGTVVVKAQLTQYLG